MEPVKQINSWSPVKQINSWRLQSSLRIKPFRSKIVTITAKITNRAEVLCASDGCGNLATAPCRESYPVSGMHNRATLIVTLSASGFAGVLIATLALGADKRHGTHAAQDEFDAAPLCTSALDVPEPTFYSEMSKVNARMHEGMEIAASSDVDRDFMRMMIPHHQGAIDMALLQLKYGHDEKLKRLAQSIIVEQGQEIAYMRTLLGTPSGAASTIHPAAGR